MKHYISWLLSFSIGLLPATFPLLAASILTDSPSMVAATRPDYEPLQNLLNQQNWQGADQETRRILQQWIHPNGDLYETPRANTIPVEVIQTLDRMWKEASGGRFGFSVQQRIWQEAVAQYPQNTNAAVKAFGDRVGWTRRTPSDEYMLFSEWLTERELTFSNRAPEGHLPWVGISWQTISTLVRDSSAGCGSCTVDAMYLQSDRFSRYIPALYNQVATALNTPSLPTHSWQARHTINLPALYPNNSCPVYTLDQAISPNSQVLAISSYSYERACGGIPNNSTLALWNAQRGTRLITLLRGQAIEAFSSDKSTQEPPTEQTRIVGDVANAIAFTPDGRQIAAGLSNGTIRFWKTDTGEALRTLSGHRYAIRAIHISPDGRFLASASSDQTVKIWNLETRKVFQIINLRAEDGIVNKVLISPDGTRLATATTKNKLQLWEIPTARLIRTFVDESVNVSYSLPILFSPNGQTLATADIDHSVKLWNPSTGARLITLKGHQNPIQSVAFSPDSRTLASSSEDNTVRLWNLQTNQSTQTLNVVQSAGHPIMPKNLGYLAFSPDGRVLATSALLLPIVQSEPIPTQGVRLWNVESGQPITDIHAVSRFNFSPNSQFLLTNGQTVQIWQSL